MKRNVEGSERRFRHMIEQSPAAVELYDVEGNLVQTNRVWKANWQEYGAVSGQAFNILQDPQAAGTPAPDWVRQALSGEAALVREWPLASRHKEYAGAVRRIRTRVYPLHSAGGKINNVVVAHEDVTKDKQAEEMLIQSEKMVSVGCLAAVMAHEINNPLAGMIQNAQVIAKRLTEPLPANRQAAEKWGISLEAMQGFMEERGIIRMLESIRLSGSRAAAIVENMLSFSRKGGSAPLPCDLRDLLDQTLELAQNDYDLKKHYDFRKVKIERDYPSAAPIAPCHPTKIQQVFLNILKNGAQAMAFQSGEDGREPCFWLRIRQDGAMVRIEIQDNGPGMDEQTKKRVFEPFFTTKGVQEGTGLGLSLSAFIVTENHGGSIRVESEKGGGTIFIICLPVHGKPA